jgi:hypothetical protein
MVDEPHEASVLARVDTHLALAPLISVAMHVETVSLVSLSICVSGWLERQFPEILSDNHTFLDTVRRDYSVIVGSFDTH